MLTMNSCPAPNINVHGRLLDGEAVVVLPEQGEVKVLNDVGARIWSLADGSRTVNEIVTIICAEYDVARSEAESDTLDFIDNLIAKGIFTLSDNGT